MVSFSGQLTRLRLYMLHNSMFLLVYIFIALFIPVRFACFSVRFTVFSARFLLFSAHRYFYLFIFFFKKE